MTNKGYSRPPEQGGVVFDLKKIPAAVSFEEFVDWTAMVREVKDRVMPLGFFLMSIVP